MPYVLNNWVTLFSYVFRNMLSTHKGHAVCSVEEAAVELREKLDDSLHECETLLAVLKASYSSACDVYATTESAILATTSRIRVCSETLHF